MPKKRSHGDGGLYPIKRKNAAGKTVTYWRGVAYVEPGEDGKRRQPMVHARTQRECQRKLDKLKEEIKANGGEPLRKGMRLDDWAEQWFRDYCKPDVDPSTYKAYSGSYKNWIKGLIGRKPVDTVKPSDITRVLLHIRSEGRAQGTARQAYLVLDRMLEQARREGLTARNVCKDVDRPGNDRPGRKAVAARQRDAIDPAVVLKLLEAAAPRKNGSLYWFKLLTGQRQGETIGAVLEDLELICGDPDADIYTADLQDINGGYYTVNWKLEELASDHGCGPQVDGVWPCGKRLGGWCPERVFRVPNDFASRQLAGRLHLTEPKSQTGKRVPLIKELAQIMVRDIRLMADKPNPHGLIWRHDDGSPIERDEEAAGWRDLLCEVGFITKDQAIPGGTEWTGHTARHTLITTLYELDVDEQLIGQIAGQSSSDVTRGYRHARDKERMRAMQKLRDRFLTTLPELPGAVS